MTSAIENGAGLGPPFTEAENALRQRAREFTAKTITPAAADHDQWATFPWKIVEQARVAGLLNTSIPRKYGGQGFSSVEELVVSEELSYGCSGIWTALNINDLAATPIIAGGTEEQKREWLGLVRDGATPAFALTEPTGGSDASNINTFAQPNRTGYVISGTKRFISNATVADFFIVFAMVGSPDERLGVSAFIVTKDSPGLRITRQFNKSAHRAYDTSEIVFDDVVVPTSRRLGAEGKGLSLAQIALERKRPLVGAAGVGVARRAYTEALEHARKRHGRAIHKLQAIGHKLANMACGIEAARLLAWRAATQIDYTGRASLLSAMAKAMATDLAMTCSVDAAQILGGAGLMRDSPIQKLMRDAKVLQIYEGPNEIQRNIVVSEIAAVRGKESGPPSRRAATDSVDQGDVAARR